MQTKSIHDSSSSVHATFHYVPPATTQSSANSHEFLKNKVAPSPLLGQVHGPHAGGHGGHGVKGEGGDEAGVVEPKGIVTSKGAQVTDLAGVGDLSGDRIEQIFKYWIIFGRRWYEMVLV